MNKAAQRPSYHAAYERLRAEKVVSPNGYSDSYGPNVAQILADGVRLIRGKVPASVRTDLREAVKDGVLIHIKKDGLKPEAFCHPNHRASAVRMREREAEHAIANIAKCAV